MRLKKLDLAFFSRRDLGTTDPGIPESTMLRRGAGRRANRARHLALEVMEDRVVLTTLPVLVSLTTMTGTTINNLQGPPFSGDPKPIGPGVQPSGDVACATFTLAAGGGPVRVGLADYTVATYPYPTTVPPTVGQQEWLNTHVYFSSSSAILDASHSTVPVSIKICINLAHCQSGQEFFQELDTFYYKDPKTNLPATSAPDNNGGLVTDFPHSDYYGYFNYVNSPGTPENELGGAVIDCTPANAAGAFSQGYYKTHPDALPDSMAIGNVVYTRDELSTLLETNPKGGDATLINVHQLITAYANEENGTPLTTDVSKAMLASDLVFDTLPILIDSSGNYNTAATVKSSTATGTILTNEAAILETFNP